MYKRGNSYKVIKVYVFAFIFTLCLMGYWAMSAPAVYADYIWNTRLGKFVNIDTKVHDTPEEQYNYAESLVQEGDIDAAIKAYDNLFRMFPNSPMAQDALVKMGMLQEEEEHDYWQAFKSYQRVIDLYPHTEKLDEITEKQYYIGTVFMSGTRGKLMGIPLLPALAQAIKVFEQITKNAPFSEYGIKAQYALGMAYKKKGDFKKAGKTFNTFISNHPTSDLIAQAAFQIAEIKYHLALKKNRDEKAVKEARQSLKRYCDVYPDTLEAEDARAMLVKLADSDAMNLLNIATYYEKESYLESAIIYYKEVIKLYPDSLWADQAKERLQAFEDPEKFLREGRTVLEERLERLSQEKDSLQKEYDAEQFSYDKFSLKMETIKEQIKGVEQDLKRVDKEKKKELKTQWSALIRKRRELKERKTKLALKEKKLRKQPSPDLEEAIARWKKSLEAEEFALDVKERELRALEQRLGIKRIGAFTDVFKKRGPNVHDIEKRNQGKLEKLHGVEKELLEQKEELYDILALEQKAVKDLEQKQEELFVQIHEALPALHKELTHEQETLGTLREELKKKGIELDRESGIVAAVLSMPTRSLTGLKGVFNRDPRKRLDAEIQQAQQKKDDLIRELQSEKESLALYTNLNKDSGNNESSKAEATETPKEKKKSDERLDERETRKKIMQTQKKINAAHRAIEDAFKEKQELVATLDETVTDIQETRRNAITQTGFIISRPVVYSYELIKMFLFGIEKKQDVVVKEAKRVEKKVRDTVDEARIRDISEQIEKLDRVIKKNELDILALELKLESIIVSVKGSLRRLRSEDVAHNKALLQKEAETKRKYIHVLEEEIKTQETQLKKLEEERNVAPSDKADTDKDAEESTEPQSQTMKEYTELKAKVHTQEVKVAEKKAKLESEYKRVIAEEKTKKAMKKIKKNVENIREKIEIHIREQEHIRADVIDLIDEEIIVMGRQKKLVQEKVDLAKECVEHLSKYENDDSRRAKDLQKQLYQELDRITTGLQDLIAEQGELAYMQ